MAVDRAYANLLSHLQRPKPGISMQTVVSAIPYYLAQLPVPHPTQLTAFVISSSLWHPLSVNSVGTLVNGYRYAVRLKETNVQNEAGGWLARQPATLLGEWASAVMKGVSRGNPQLRIAILGGLLLGFNDLGHGGIRAGVRDRLENQIVIAFAELLEGVSTPKNLWKTEFKGQKNEYFGERNSLLLYSAYYILPCVAAEKVAALEILALTYIAEKGVENAFSGGKFLSQPSLSIIRNSDGQFSISPESRLMLSLRKMNDSTLYKDISHLARLLSQCLSLLADQKPLVAWQTFRDVSRSIETITSSVEKDWKQSPLAALTSEQDLDRDGRESSTEIWKVLKTLLFSHLVISQSILSSIRYLQPLSAALDVDHSPSSIACSILRSLYHLSFVISQFGGITSSAGFKELKRVCYMALDIVAADPAPRTGATFVEELVSNAQDSLFVSAHPFRQSQTVYALVIVEQLIPILTDPMIEDIIVPFCHRYLTTPDHHETYEAAHSVMLSIFTTHSQQKATHPMTTSGLAERLVPFYVDLLLQDSATHRLNTSQLRTAYSNLVRSATSSGDDAVTWLCIDGLLKHLEAAHPSPSSNQMPLYLALTSLISCVPLSLLPRVLSEVEKVLDAVDSKARDELRKVILEEITNQVGDREKETVLSWWCRVAPDSISTSGEQSVSTHII